MNTQNNNKKSPERIGRPSKYKAVLSRLNEILTWAEEGKTEKEIAEKLGISISSFKNYKNENKELSKALKKAKAYADEIIVDSLYKRAIGYNHITTEEEIKPSGERHVKIKEVHVPGNITALIFWLKNRRPQEWRDRVTFEHTRSDLPEMLAKAFARQKKLQKCKGE